MKQTNNFSDNEFETLDIRMLSDLGKRKDEFCEAFNKGIENIKRN